ncbi:imm11 family protein [Treponema sp. UBA3813]|uniref:imm11 family protein n=1 Tax=Treponema sp. UBA3813 TaxID=1947715 RepID=UPI0025EB84AB|nr:DUF1629 domain-containing protein [Treponema sp. UBA3813]
MNIYILRHDAENYRWLEYKGNWFDFFWNLQDSVPIKEFHEKIICKQIRDKKERTLGDFPCFVVPALSQNAKNTLGKYFENLVEIFPLECGKLGQYYFMNVINVLDCLDEEKSKLEFFDDGRIFKIINYEFKHTLTDFETRIFKIQKKERGEIYVNEETKNLIETAGLKGFVFEKVGYF